MRAYGFVPNGLRTYYLGRSQPPLLTQMVAAVIDGGEAPLVAAAQSSNPAASPVDACQHEGVSTELLLEASLRPSCTEILCGASALPVSLMGGGEGAQSEG